MADRVLTEIERRVLRATINRPGYHSTRRPWRIYTEAYQATWTLWKMGLIRPTLTLAWLPTEMGIERQKP